MAGSPSEGLRRWAGPARAALAGAALGILGFASGSLVLYQVQGMLPAAAGLVSTLVVALAAGLWAGAPAARAGAPPVRRWMLAGVALGVAGIFATAWALRQGEPLGGAGRVLALLVLVGVPVYALGLLLASLSAWEAAAGAADVEDDDDADQPAEAGFGGAGRVAFWALVGAGVGAAAAGLLLLPMLPPGTLLLGTAALLTFPLFFPRARDEAPGVEEHVLFRGETPFGVVQVTETVYPGQRQPELRLYQDDEIESGELSRSGAPSFAYVAAAERWLGKAAARGDRYLFLGGGAYTLPRRVAERDPSARIAVVELDPEVTRVAYRFFGLRPEHGVASLHGDARGVAATLPEGSADRIFLDVYDGTESIPHHLVTREALETYRRLLAPGGSLLVNVIGVAAGPGALRLWSTVRTVADVFPGRAVYHHLGRGFPERQNFLVAASAVADAAFPEMVGGFEPWPEAEWPELPGITVFRDREPPGERVPEAREAAG